VTEDFVVRGQESETDAIVFYFDMKRVKYEDKDH